MLPRTSILLLLGSPCLSGQVDRPGDVVHPAYVSGIRKLGKRLMEATGSAHPRRIYVIVNPALRGEDPKRLRAAIDRWGGKERQLPDPIKQVLVGAGDIPPLYHVLRKISYQFIRLAFQDNVLEVRSIRRILEDAAQEKEAIVVSVDGRLRRGAEPGALEVELSIRVHRLELAKARVARIELIYMDQARGTARNASVPDRDPNTGPETAIRQTLRTIETAVVDALNRRIAHSLLVNPRIVGTSWVGAARARRGKVVEASINRAAGGEGR